MTSNNNNISSSKLIQAASGYAIFFVSPDGLIEGWPETAETLYRYDAESVLHEPLDRLWADTGDSGDTTPKGNDDSLEALLEQATDRDVTVERWHSRADGSVFWATTTIAPVLNAKLHGYTVVSYDTTSRKQYERMLEHQNDRLKEFTDILSHDLQSPLSVVNGSLTLYRHTGESEHLETIDETVERMRDLVDDLLRVARHGDVVRDARPVDLEEVITVAQQGAIPVDATLEYERVPPVIAEEKRLLQLFQNLFRNSTEHMSSTQMATDGGKPSGGARRRLAVRVGPLPSKNGFYVEDNGPGIPVEVRPDVFDHGFTTRKGGHGFGLSVVRTIANAHGWDIIVTDGSVGGARFELTGVKFAA